MRLSTLFGLLGLLLCAYWGLTQPVAAGLFGGSGAPPAPYRVEALVIGMTLLATSAILAVRAAYPGE